MYFHFNIFTVQRVSVIFILSITAINDLISDSFTEITDVYLVLINYM